MKKKVIVIILIILAAALTAQADSKPLGFLNKIGQGISSSKISLIAKKDVGTYYKKGVSLQCANYVGHVVERAGGSPPQGKASARSWLKWGKRVSFSGLKPGDIIVTSRGRSSRSGHILIYKGDGKAIHRSTRYKPIGEISVDYYKSRIIGIRRVS
tara:strand:- start:938 stop:1405 length:468 start_codon:yes stop_codon:yes gene_type:complete